MLIFGTRQFDAVRGSDIIRDGMYLELSEHGGKQGVAEVFFSDQTGEFVLNTFGNDVPLEAIEWLVSEARTSLPSKD
jgi:hypothetical protein